MKKIVLFDTAEGSLNQGDNIIMLSVKKGLRGILKNNFTITLPTHTPSFSFYQQFNKNRRYRFTKEAKYKFIGGSNILNNKMMHPWANWNINLFNCYAYKNCILVGVGSNNFKDGKVSLYSKLLYKTILSKDYVHSTRDDKAKKVLESMGFKAINTGCPTTWGLTTEFNKQIETEKSNRVVFTLTDYRGDIESDQLLIDTLINSYKEVYFWPQGSGDYEYFKKFNNIEKIKIVSPDVEGFSEILSTNIDYIGTRLHAGIFAMQHKVRSIIIIVDERAREMNKCYNLNCIEREDIINLPQIINRKINTNVNIKVNEIEKWKSQFA